MKRPVCDKCGDAGRESLAQEIRETLRSRGRWAPARPSDLIGAVASAIDELDAAFAEIRAIAGKPGGAPGIVAIVDRVSRHPTRTPRGRKP